MAFVGQCEPNASPSREWVVDLSTRKLRVNNVAVAIGSRAFKIVVKLARSSGEFVSKDDLMRSVWPDAKVVEDGTIRLHVSAIRKALGADRGMLETVTGRGFDAIEAELVRRGVDP